MWDNKKRTNFLLTMLTKNNKKKKEKHLEILFYSCVPNILMI